MDSIKIESYSAIRIEDGVVEVMGIDYDELATEIDKERMLDAIGVDTITDYLNDVTRGELDV